MKSLEGTLGIHISDGWAKPTLVREKVRSDVEGTDISRKMSDVRQGIAVVSAPGDGRRNIIRWRINPWNWWFSWWARQGKTEQQSVCGEVSLCVQDLVLETAGNVRGRLRVRGW